MGLVAALGIGMGIVLVVVGWTKRDERWASPVFWVGVILVLLPIGWELLRVFSTA